MANYHESSKTIDNLFVGQVYHSVGIDEMEYLNLALIGVSKDGKIELFRNIDTSNLITEDLAEREIQNLKDKGWKIEKTVILKNTEFLIPGNF